MASSNDPHSSSADLRIRRGKVDSLSLYEITESELETLERGSPSSLLFNLSVALISTSCSFFISLMSAEITSDRTFMVFVVIVVVGGVAGFVLGLLWWRTRQDVGEIILRIKKRIPSEDDERIEQDPEANA
jgi:hypothetical protein